MPRYIDVDALMKEFRDFVRDSNNSDFAPVPNWNDAVSLVGAAPTADVVERKKGKWEQKEDPYGFFDTIPVCSVCGCTTKMREKYAYCPNCGAEMKSQEEV